MIDDSTRHRACAARAVRGAGRVVALVCLLAASPARAGDLLESWHLLPKEDKALYLNLGGAAAITAWGIAHWDYFQNAPSADSEGWFGADTRYGGADKLGHLWLTYAGSHALGALYHHWGYDEEDAGRLGALSSLGLMTLMEVGDSMSGSYGFSYEDALMNVAGAGVGYLLWTRPELARYVDLRAEWEPNTSSSDPFTDYDNLKYLVVLKLEGFDALRTTPLRFVELNAGYYTRGYDSHGASPPERDLFVGVGINISQLIREAGHPKVGRVFNYIQVPYTYVSFDRNLND